MGKLLSSFASILAGAICIVAFFSCHQGDPAKFTELPTDQVTAENTPEGLIFRNGALSLEEGFSIETSQDSTQALIIGPGRGSGKTSLRCECDYLIKLGCIVSSKDIIACNPIICTTNKCKSILQIYEGPVSISKFREYTASKSGE